MTLTSGDRLGPYTIQGLLGAGGMGEVYRADDPRLGRAVALKVISQRLVGDAGSRRRFESEARAASALNHPAIVTIYDIGDTNEVSWIAMELVEGSTLRDVIAEGPLPIRRAWSIANQLAGGLAAAHAKQIVHRDLKPENVMVTGDGRIKILDFGLARQQLSSLLEGNAATVTVGPERTAPGAILGTVGYMSPEQAAGQPADFRSDQFSFGAILYELLTARKPFARPTAVETLSAIIRDEPPSLTSIRGDVSTGFARVIGKCLEKQPGQRFQSTGELAAAVESLTPDSSSVEPLIESASQGKPLVRPPLVLLTAIAATLIAATVLATLLWNRPGGDAITSVAVLPFANVAADPELEYIGDGLTDSLIDHLSRANALKVMARATVLRFNDEQPAPTEVARALGVGAVVTGTLARRDRQIVVSAELIDGSTGERLWGQTFDRPLAELMPVQDSIVMAIVQALRLRLSGEERARLSGFGTSDPEAYELFLKGRYLQHSDTEEDDLAARKLFIEAIAKDPKFVDAYLALSSSYARAAGGGYEPPDEANAHAAEALKKAAELDPGHIGVRVATAHQRFLATRDWDATEREYRALMKEPAVLRSIQYHPISLFFVARGRPDEAVALVERALELDPGNVESRVMLGNFLLQAGRLDAALRVYNTIAAEQREDPRPMFGAAEVYKRRGLYEQAAAARRNAYALSDDAASASAFARVTTETEYAKAEIAAARLHLRFLEQLATERYVPVYDIAKTHAQIGNREQALAGLEKAAADKYVGLMLLKVDPAWDSFRSDPRFAAVVRQVGIP